MRKEDKVYAAFSVRSLVSFIRFHSPAPQPPSEARGPEPQTHAPARYTEQEGPPRPPPRACALSPDQRDPSEKGRVPTPGVGPEGGLNGGFPGPAHTPPSQSLWEVPLWSSPPAPRAPHPQEPHEYFHLGLPRDPDSSRSLAKF